MDSRMRAIGFAVVAAGVALLTSGGAAASPGALAGSLSRHAWRTAEEVPGAADLNQGGIAGIFSVSCASAGNCSAGGQYMDSSGRRQALVVSQVSGTWGTAIEVPGTAALNQGENAEIASVSCASAGNCSAGGHYINGFSQRQALVVGQVHGTWQRAIKVPVAAALHHGNA